ncbi:MAG TPA: selenocysteine-specific translation elongation factor, partial [Actinomycetota bacterium]|nr:selenocysteine-specific translation elongation factor [Actinomycetota bacterium]
MPDGDRVAHRVVATAGHVDHGKSSLIVRLTGIDPDRWAEEKRRGLTIDLGYAWCELPSGREVGFVDVPGHERFIRNMLAGVGPAPLVMFVVAADEGWKPQSEEHLEILDVLGVTSGVIALTKCDLVDLETIGLAEQEILDRLDGTMLEGAPIVQVSSLTGEGIDDLRTALDAMIDRAPFPHPSFPRLFVDRVFTIKGAGTVTTGTLTGECLTVGDEVSIEPGDRRVRIRSLQTHRRREDRACPIARVAVNLVGAERDDLGRGDVITRPGEWAPTSTFDVELRAVRGLAKSLTARGAFKVYAGAAESDARVRFLDGTRLEPDGRVFARLRTAGRLVLAVGDRVVLREAGRRATVAGGPVLDIAPGKATLAAPRLAARLAAPPEELATLLVRERGAISAADVPRLVGTEAPGSAIVGAWAVDPELRAAWERAVSAALAGFHDREPLAPGAPAGEIRGVVAERLRTAGAPTEPELVDAAIGAMIDAGTIEREAGLLRLAGHRVSFDADDVDVQRLLAAIGGENTAAPPTISELERAGVGRGVIDAAVAAGLAVRVSSDLVFVPEVVARAEALVRAATEGITVSTF